MASCLESWLRELSAVESSRGSFQDASDAIARATGVRLGKRQLEQLAARAAADFETFYTDPSRDQATATEGDLLVLSADGKGIVMRPDPTRCAPPPPRQPAKPPPSWRPGCPAVRNATGNGWPRSVPCTT